MGRVRQLDDDERRPHPVGATPRLLGQARFGKRSPDERYPGSPPAVVIPHVAGYGRLAACTAPSCAAGRSPDGSRPISAVPPIATELCEPQRTARSATTRLMHRSKHQSRLLDHLVGAGEQSGIRRFLGGDTIREHIYFPIPWIGRHLCPDPVRKREFLASVS